MGTSNKQIWECILWMMDCFQTVTDILFTDSLEGLRMKYKEGWKEMFEFDLRKCGEFFAAIFPPERVDFSNYDQLRLKQFVFVMTPRSGKCMEADLSSFRILSDQAVAVMRYA